MGIGVSYSVRVSPAAIAHIQEAQAYYGAIDIRLVKRFKEEVSAKLRGLQTFNAYTIRYDDVRSVPLGRFPYLLYFVVFEAEALVEVVALLYERQDRD